MKNIFEKYENLKQRVYIADAETYEILFMNKILREDYGGGGEELYRGRKCYEVLQNSANPCTICGNRRLNHEEFYVWDYHDPVLRKGFRLRDKLLDVNGRRCHIEFMEELSELPESERDAYDPDQKGSMVNEAIRMSLYEKDPEKSIKILLEYMGQSLGVDRALLYENREDSDGADLSYEWCKYGMSQRAMEDPDIVQEACVVTRRKIKRSQPIFLEDTEVIPEYRCLREVGVRSALIYPLWLQDTNQGFITFENPEVSYLSELYQHLKTLGHFIESLMLSRGLVKKLEKISTKDQMTGFGNRYAVKLLEAEIRREDPLGVVFCDVSGLKAMNDAHGHSEGDRLLLRAAEALSKSFPDYDLFRIGGDEYLVVARGISEGNLSNCVAKLRRLTMLNNTPLAIGCVWRPQLGEETLERLMDEADQLMYADKRAYYAELSHDRREGGKHEGEKKKEFRLDFLTEHMLFDGLALAAGNVYVYKANITENYSVWSDNAIRYFDIPENYQTNFGEIWTEKIHPEDRASYIKDIADVFSGKKDQHYCQYRIRNAMGEYVWVDCSGWASVDPVTGMRYFVGLVNRLDVTNKFDPITKFFSLQEFHRIPYQGDYTLFIFGLDQFRRVINQIGFTESNRILFLMGLVLREHSANDAVFRMTGDEFIMITEHLDREAQQRLIQEIQSDFKERVTALQFGIRVGFSTGSTHYRAYRDTKEEVLKRLEHCLDYSKQSGKEIFTKYSAVVDEEYEYKLRLQAEIAQAVEHDFEGFQLVYQPVIDVKNHRIDGSEALLRFVSKEYGMVSPLDFIPILESTGDILPVGRWVAETAIRQKAVWEKRYPGFRMGFNVSLLQLQDRELTEYIAELVTSYGLKADEIVVELTESQRMEDPEMLRYVLEPLAQVGCWIFLDDFGMEASTFTLVQELPVNGIKVDHSFVRVMADSGSDRKDIANKAIVDSIHYLGRLLQVRVVVEGVENEKIDTLLKHMNADYLQGYYYSRPVPPEEIEEKWF